MNVFVLNTGRCGSMTFSRACSHITNFTAGHETNNGKLDRLTYPDNHIEVDNKLSWFLGSLDALYPDAFYVRLYRNPEATVSSFRKRKGSIVDGFATYILNTKRSRHTDRLYVSTVDANIRKFLHDKYYVNMDIDSSLLAFKNFWMLIGAEGDLDAALNEFKIKYNSSKKWL